MKNFFLSISFIIFAPNSLVASSFLANCRLINTSQSLQLCKSLDGDFQLRSRKSIYQRSINGYWSECSLRRNEICREVSSFPKRKMLSALFAAAVTEESLRELKSLPMRVEQSCAANFIEPLIKGPEVPPMLCEGCAKQCEEDRKGLKKEVDNFFNGNLLKISSNSQSRLMKRLSSVKSRAANSNEFTSLVANELSSQRNEYYQDLDDVYNKPSEVKVSNLDNPPSIILSAVKDKAVSCKLNWTAVV